MASTPNRWAKYPEDHPNGWCGFCLVQRWWIHRREDLHTHTKQMKLSTFVAAAAVIGSSFIFSNPSKAAEWDTACGVSRSRLTSCRVSKGDAFLRGSNGISYTYKVSNIGTMQRFTPHGNGTACNQRGYMRKDFGPWFNDRSYCQRSGGNTYEIYQLPSGNSMLVELHW